MRNGLVAGAMILAACGDGATAPGTNPEIINTADNFQYQVSNIQQFSGTQTYSWQNSGTTATVNQSASIASGSARSRQCSQSVAARSPAITAASNESAGSDCSKSPLMLVLVDLLLFRIRCLTARLIR